MAKSFQGEAIQPPVPFNSALPSIKPSCSILQNGGVIFLQLSCHILENVNERVCKIKFMGCQWRIRTRRAITYLLSSRSLWYVKQKSMQLNAGISIVLHFTMDVGHCLFSLHFPFLYPPFILKNQRNKGNYRPLGHLNRRNRKRDFNISFFWLLASFICLFASLMPILFFWVNIFVLMFPWAKILQVCIIFSLQILKCFHKNSTLKKCIFKGGSPDERRKWACFSYCPSAAPMPLQWHPTQKPGVTAG